MGIDVVEIGVRHRLPVHEPKKFAKEISDRLNWNVRLIYRNEFVYNKEKNQIEKSDGDDEPIITEFLVDNTNKYLQIIICNYQQKEIIKQIGENKMGTVSFQDKYVEECFDFNDDKRLYEIESKNTTSDEMIWSDVYEENIEIPYYIVERWRLFTECFNDKYNYPGDRELLAEIRQKVYDLAKKLGCEQVIYCSDEYYSSEIYCRAYYPADKLLEFAKSMSYMKTSRVGYDKIKDIKHKARVIYFSSYFKGELDLKDGEYVDVVIDDFEGLE